MSKVILEGVESNADTATGEFEKVTVTASGTKTGLDVMAVNSLVPEAYDYISLTYTGSDLTGVVYKTGGSGGTTVATLTLTYSSNILQTVTRS